MKAERRPVPPVTAAYLERAALHYLGRYGATAAMLRRVLVRRVENRCRRRAEDPGPALALIEPVVVRALTAGLVDDATFARARAATLRRRGGSARLVAAKLAQKGVDRETIAAVLDDPDADRSAVELAAAQAFARRRRLGAHRASDPAPFRARDLAVLARAGFSSALARAALDPPEDSSD